MPNISIERDQSIDAIKTFSIYAVIISHIYTFQIDNCETLHLIHDVLYTFNMPLFAIVSGYFFSLKSGPSFFFRAKIIQLLLPILFWSLIGMFVMRIPHDISVVLGGEDFHLQSYLRDLIFNLKYNFWFLKSLFLCFSYLYITLIFNKKHIYINIFLSVIILYFASLVEIIPNKCLFVEGFIYLYPFFAIGYIINKRNFLYRKIIKNNYLLLSCVSLFIWGMLFSRWLHTYCFYTVNTGMFAPPYPSPYSNAPDIYGWLVPVIMLYRFIIGFVGSFMLMFFIKWMDGYIHDNNIYIWVVEIGKTTLGIYVMQDVLLPLFYETKIEDVLSFSFAFTLIFSLILLIIMSHFVKVTRNKGLISLIMWGRR